MFIPNDSQRFYMILRVKGPAHNNWITKEGIHNKTFNRYSEAVNKVEELIKEEGGKYIIMESQVTLQANGIFSREHYDIDAFMHTRGGNNGRFR